MSPEVDWRLAARCPKVPSRELSRRLLLRKRQGVVTRENLVWRSIDGHLDTLDSMDDRHLTNIQRYLTGRGDLEMPPAYEQGESFSLVVEIIEAEMDRRGLTRIESAHKGAIEREISRQKILHESEFEVLSDDAEVEDYMALVERRYKEARP